MIGCRYSGLCSETSSVVLAYFHPIVRYLSLPTNGCFSLCLPALLSPLLTLTHLPRSPTAASSLILWLLLLCSCIATNVGPPIGGGDDAAAAASVTATPPAIYSLCRVLQRHGSDGGGSSSNCSTDAWWVRVHSLPPFLNPGPFPFCGKRLRRRAVKPHKPATGTWDVRLTAAPHQPQPSAIIRRLWC